jgi:toxin ParE1/3/4
LKPVKFSIRAQRDLERIGDEIAVGRPIRARTFVLEIIARCQRIAQAPEGFALRPEFGPGIRAVVVHPYLVLYRILPDMIWIITVRHGARRPARLSGKRP